MRGILIIFGTVVGVLAALFIWGIVADRRHAEKIKPSVTYERLLAIGKACDEFKEQRGEWPRSLDELLAIRPELRDPWAKDAWNRDFVLIPYNDAKRYGELISYGRDNRPGGIGADRDFVIRFPLRTNADWNRNAGVGLERPERVP